MQSLMNAMRAVAASQEFREWYRCLSEERLGQADKILLPPSALHKLASKNTSYPMMFHISNPELAHLAQHLHGGVLEFDAPEGTCYLPQWMMARLLIEPGGLVCVLNVTLPAGKSVVFQPHAHAFTKLANPRAVLENRLSKFSCLTMGQAVPVNYMDKIFWLDVVRLKDAKGNAQAVSIVETDISVEFEAALDAAAEAKNSSSSNSSGSSSGSSASKSASASASGDGYPSVADAFGDSLAPVTFSSSAAAVQTPIAASATASASARSPPLVAASSPSLKGTAAAASLATSAIIAGDGSVKIVRPTSSYFDRLGGGGQRLNGKPVASSSSPLGAQPLGEAAPPVRGAPLGAAGSPLGAMPHAMPLSRSMSATSPTSASSSSSSSFMSGVSFPSTPPAGAPALERSSSLNSSGKKIVTVVENGFRYSYEVASSGARRLLRRDPVDAAALAVSPTAGQGYSLKK